MASALVVFAKTPRAGASKTRLVPPLTFEDAAALSRCFIADAATTVAAVARRRGATACVAYEGDAGAMAELVGPGLRLFKQRGNSFGSRLRNAALDALACGHDAVCLIGSDSPTLPERTLDGALDALEQPGECVVIGPADDGGYYLIGLKTPYRVLFDDRRIAWSTASVASQTLSAARELRLEPVVLERWYDVDDIQSLRVLAAELSARGAGDTARATRELLARLVVPRSVRSA